MAEKQLKIVITGDNKEAITAFKEVSDEASRLATTRVSQGSAYLNYLKQETTLTLETNEITKAKLELTKKLQAQEAIYGKQLQQLLTEYVTGQKDFNRLRSEGAKLIHEQALAEKIARTEFEKTNQVILAGLVKQKLQEEQQAALLKEQETSKLTQVKERLDNEAAYWKQVKAKELQYETDTRKAIEKGWEETFKLREEQVKRLNLLQNMSGFKATSMSFTSSDNKQASDRMLAGMAASYQLSELAKIKAGQEAYTLFLQEEEAKRVKLHQEAFDRQKFEDQANLNARKVQVAAFIDAVESKEKEEAAVQKELAEQKAFNTKAEANSRLIAYTHLFNEIEAKERKAVEVAKELEQLKSHNEKAHTNSMLVMYAAMFDEIETKAKRSSFSSLSGLSNPAANADAARRMIEGMSSAGRARQAELDKLRQIEEANFALVERILKKTVQAETDRQAALDALAKKEEERKKRLVALREENTQSALKEASRLKEIEERIASAFAIDTEVQRRKAEERKVIVNNLNNYIKDKNETTLQKLRKDEEFYTDWINKEYLKRASGYNLSTKADSRAPASGSFQSQGFGGASKEQLAAQLKNMQDVEAQMLKLKENFLFLQNKAEWQKLQDFKLVEEAMLKLEQDKVASEKKLEQELTDYKKLKLDEQRKYAEQEARDELLIRQRELEALKKSMLASSVSAGVVGTSQQTLLAESRRRLAILDGEYQLKAARTKYGENSNQVIRQQAANKIVEIEQRMADRLKNIQEKVLAGKRTEAQGIAQSDKLIKQYQEQIAHQKELTRSTEQLKSAHIDLFKFIGLSTLYWNVWHQSLYRTLDLLKSIPKVGMELETSKSVLAATMGGATGAEIVLRGLHEEAKRTGIEISALRETWRTFSASTTIAGESIKTSWKIFTNMNTVITSLHYSGDKASHIFMALAQMFNKSKVQSEELVKQLGNLLPGAFAAFAKANNMTTMELVSSMKKGMVFAHNTIENFTEFYADRFKGAFATASHSLNANLGRMQTAFSELGETIYAEVSPALSSAVTWMTALAKAIAVDITTTKTLQSAFSNILTVFGGYAVVRGLAASFTYLFGTLQVGLAPALVGLATFAARLTTLKEALLVLATRTLPMLAGGAIFGFAVKWVYDGITEDKYGDFLAKFKKDHQEFTELLEAGKPVELEVTITKDPEIIKFSDAAIKARQHIENLTYAMNVYKDNVAKGFLKNTKSFRFENKSYSVETATTELNRLYNIEKQAFADLARQRKELRAKDLEATEQAAGEATTKTLEAQEAFHIEYLKRSTDFAQKKLGLELDYVRMHKDKIVAIENDLEAARYDRQLQLATPKELREFTFVYDAEFKAKAEAIQKNRILDRTKADIEQANNLNRLNAALQAQREYESNKAVAVAEGLGKLDKLEDDAANKTIERAKKTAEEQVRILKEANDQAQNVLDNQLKILDKSSNMRVVEDTARLERELINDKIERQKVIIKQLEEIEARQTSLGKLASTSEATSSKGNALDVSILKLAKREGLDYGKLQEAFKQGAKTAGLDEYVFKAQAGVESEFNLNARSSRGAEGLFQFIPETARKYQVDVKDAYSSIRGAGELMRDNMKAFHGDVKLALAAYNAGFGYNKQGKPLGATWLAKAENRHWLESPDTTTKGLWKSETAAYPNKILARAGAEAGMEDASEQANQTLSQAKKQLEDMYALQETKELEWRKLQQDRSNIVGKMAQEAKAAYGIVGSESEKFFQANQEDYKLMLLNLESGNIELIKQAGAYFDNVRAVQSLMDAKQKLAEIERQSVVDLQSYRTQLEDIQRLEGAGMAAGFSNMWEKDKANAAILARKKEDLAATLEAQAGITAPPELLRGAGWEDQFSATSERVRSLNKEIKDLELSSQSVGLTVATAIGDNFDKTFRGVIDGSLKAKDAFREFGLGVIKTLQDIILQELKSQIIKLAFSGISGIFGGVGAGVGSGIGASAGGGAAFANGGAFYNGNIIPFAKGGIVSKPTLFKFAKGTGLMGEAGAEAIMPLARDSSGKLGVKANGLGTASQQNNVYNINVSVSQAKDETADMTGLKVAQAAMQAIAQAEIAKAQRPGNTLNRTTKFG